MALDGDPHERTRREYLALAGVTTTSLLAGCASNDGSENGTDNDTGSNGNTTENGDTAENGGESTNYSNGPGGQTIPEGVIQFRRSLERWGYYPNKTVPDAVEEDWRLPEVNTGDHSAAKASPVPLPDSGVLFPGDDGYLNAVDPDGEIRWQAETDMVGRGIHGTPAVADGRVYIGAYDGSLYAFDVDSGEELWETPLGGSIGSSPLYHDGTVIMAVEFPDPEGKMFAVDAESGEITWEELNHRPTDHPHSTPAIAPEDGYMVCGSNDGYLYCWNYPDLEFQWRFSTNPSEEGEIKGPVATYDGAAFFGSWDNNIYRVDLESGTEDWRFETGYLSMTGPGIDPDSNTVYMGSHDHNLYALDATTGEERWAFEANDWFTGCPTICQDRILVGAKDDTLYAIEKDTGEEVWHVENEGVVTSTPRVIDGAIYYAERAPYPEEGQTDGGGYKLVAADG